MSEIRFEKLKTLRIDVEKGIYEVNGRDISQSGKYLNLTFEEGVWSLVVSEDTAYTVGERKDLGNTVDNEMKVTKKEWMALKRSVADLEAQIQDQLTYDPDESKRLLSETIKRLHREATRDNALKSS